MSPHSVIGVGKGCCGENSLAFAPTNRLVFEPANPVAFGATRTSATAATRAKQRIFFLRQLFRRSPPSIKEHQVMRERRIEAIGASRKNTRFSSLVG